MAFGLHSLNDLNMSGLCILEKIIGFGPNGNSMMVLNFSDSFELVSNKDRGTEFYSEKLLLKFTDGSFRICAPKFRDLAMLTKLK